jgi:glyoxylase-like metal-dependent hydrolase (beta-lactamase superfamily II)
MLDYAPYEDLGDGITLVDTGLARPGMAACYLIESHGSAAVFDTGTRHTVPLILAALAARGLAPADVRHVIPSHVHLDHAGGAGALLQELPNADVLAHPRALRHLIDPSVLQASAEQVYGIDVVAKTYGRLVPVPETRIRALADGECIELNGRRLYAMDSPGHARHHLTLYDETSASWFTGDCFGIRYREFDGGAEPMIFPTTSPVQFEPEAMKKTIARMLERAPRAMQLTHYGRIDRPAERAAALIRVLDLQVECARACFGRDDAHDRLVEQLQRLYFEEVRRLGTPIGEADARPLLAIDADLNAQGMLIWLSRGAGA